MTLEQSLEWADLDAILAPSEEGELLSVQVPNAKVGKKLCSSCKIELCEKECFDGNRKTCRGCLRSRRTYQRKKRRERLERKLRREITASLIGSTGVQKQSSAELPVPCDQQGSVCSKHSVEER